MMLGGDPQLDRELRAETRRHSRRRAYLVLLGGILIFLVAVLLVGEL